MARGIAAAAWSRRSCISMAGSNSRSSDLKNLDERHDEILGALILDEATPRLWRQRHRH